MDLWIWLKIKYESAAKLDPLRLYYAKKIRSLKLRANGSIHNYIDRFQGMTILWQAIDTIVQMEHRLATQMVEQIEDPLFSGPCESIKNWAKARKSFAIQQLSCVLTRLVNYPARPRRQSKWR